MNGVKIDGPYKVTVDYTKSIAWMIKWMIKLCRFDEQSHHVDDMINGLYPISGEGIVETQIVLIDFQRAIVGTDVIPELETLGFRPANLAELCAFAAKYLDSTERFSILACGSIWVDGTGVPYIPCIDNYEGWSRILAHHCINGALWPEGAVFAAVPK